MKKGKEGFVRTVGRARVEIVIVFDANFFMRNFSVPSVRCHIVVAFVTNLNTFKIDEYGVLLANLAFPLGTIELSARILSFSGIQVLVVIVLDNVMLRRDIVIRASRGRRACGRRRRGDNAGRTNG
jgi:hypothetical protein